MTLINFSHACVDFPIFNSKNRTLKNSFLSFATGGQLEKSVHGHMVVRALDNLNLSLCDGDRLALLGHNGAGKSTLLRLISGIYHPSCGEVVVQGTIGSLIDISLGINSEATGRENIFIRGYLLGMKKKEIISKLDEIIDFSELGNFIDMPLHTYSTGMHLRLAFAISTVIRPEILLMDEWLSVGDETFKKKAENRIMDLVTKTNILVLATHSRELAEKVCNRGLWLEHGKIAMDNNIKSVSRAYFGD